MMTTKKSDKKREPELRFPGFEGEWEEKTLGTVAKFLNAKRKPIKSSDRSKMQGKYPYYGASGIIDYVNNYIFDDELILLGEDGENILSRNLPLAFRVSGKCWINNHAHVIKPKKGTNIDFLTINLERVNYVIYNTGTAQPKLNKAVCESIPTYFPKLIEQQKIATFLTSIDTRIQQLEKKRTLLEQYKKGMMQQIFKQEIRFRTDDGEEFVEWEEKKLKQVSDILKGKQLNREELTETGKYPCQNGGINPSGYTDKFNTIENTITISEGGNSCGYVNLMTSKFWCGGHCYSLVNLKKEIINEYLFQYLKYNQRRIMRLRVGSGLPNIQRRDIINFKIRVPHIAEQTKIAHFLSAIDKKIAAVDEQIGGTKEWKKGVLQQLFV